MSKVNFGLVEVDLNQFVGAIKTLVSVDLDIESKNAISKMIEEVRKTYDAIVKSILPFYNVVQSDDSKYVALQCSQEMLYMRFLRNLNKEL
ncbi:MAG: hypothetical protein WAM22_02400 [Nitrososphaeraceae archaeon]